MRILFMGTPEFAVPSFDVLNSEYEIVGAFTKIDKPNMRGKKIKFTPVKEYALEHNIPVYQPNTLKSEETQNLIKELNPDLIVVVAYGKILPKEIIEMPKYGVINGFSSSKMKTLWLIRDGKTLLRCTRACTKRKIYLRF